MRVDASMNIERAGRRRAMLQRAVGARRQAFRALHEEGCFVTPPNPRERTVANARQNGEGEEPSCLTRDTAMPRPRVRRSPVTP